MANFTFKSVLATAALFAAMSANALEVTNANGVLTLDYTVAGDFNIENYLGDANIRVNTRELVIKGNYQHVNAITNFSDWGIETLDLTEAVLPEYYKFRDLYKLSEIKWPTVLDANGQKKTFIIPEGCFETGSATGSLVNLTIPSNCAEVRATAFSNSVAKEITIEGPSTILRTRSFFNADSVKNVYVLSGEETYKTTDWSGKEVDAYYCEKAAFDYDITWVQTQINRVDEAACLHYPADATKDVFVIPGVDVLTQKVLNDKYHEWSKNGWHEFIKNDNAIVKDYQIFRTFSDTYDHLFPQCSDPKKGVKVYFVVGTTTVNGKQKILIEPANEDDDFLLPAYTGVLLYTEQGFVMYETKEDNFTCIAQYYEKTPYGNENYLECLQDAPEDGIYLTWATMRNNKQCVNMFLNNKRDCDEAPVAWGFYTIIPKHYAKSEVCYRAFLNMPTDILESTEMYGFNDGTGDVPPAIQNNNGKVLDLDLGSEDIEDESTGITYTVVRSKVSNDQNYYNLSGQAINQPAKGLYIHNGKKFMK